MKQFDPVVKMFDPVLKFVTGSRHNIRRITFNKAGAFYMCYVWEDSLWVALKDVVLLPV